MSFPPLSRRWQKFDLNSTLSYRTRFIAPIRSVHKTCTQRTHERSSERAYTTRPNLREDPVKADSGQRRHALKTILENPKLQPTPRRGLPQYPRIRQKKHAFTCKEICRDFNYVKEKETLSDIVISAQGRIISTRTLGKRLRFVDIFQDGQKLQILCDLKDVSGNIEGEELEQQFGSLQRGDIISIQGHPHRTARGELSIKAIDLPEILVPCLQPFPERTTQAEAEKPATNNALETHIELLTYPDRVSDLRRRTKIIRVLRDFFHSRDFLEVDTPILAGAAGGAVARAFQTTASEFPERNVSLRIAPELWLKRLVIGGLERVFEIGPAFRNEGLDKTHNPEFHTCEFYSTYTTLDDLISLTQELLKTLAPFSKNQEIATSSLEFSAVPFIPSLENAVDSPLPPLHHPGASSSLLKIFDKHSIPKPNPPTLPRLLDKLASHFLEPSFRDPKQPFTFLTHHPVALSPLAKSYLDPETGQYVAPRAELYINGLEVANMYEEENDPQAQREKFLQQTRWAAEGTTNTVPATNVGSNSPGHSEKGEEGLKIDEDYIRALEWGLPPTGGWGCGIDRLVMTLLGKERIAEVLTFGGLRGLTRNAERRRGV